MDCLCRLGRMPGAAAPWSPYSDLSPLHAPPGAHCLCVWAWRERAMRDRSPPCDPMRRRAAPMRPHAPPCAPMRPHAPPCAPMHRHAPPCDPMRRHAPPCAPARWSSGWTWRSSGGGGRSTWRRCAPTQHTRPWRWRAPAAVSRPRSAGGRAAGSAPPSPCPATHTQTLCSLPPMDCASSSVPEVTPGPSTVCLPQAQSPMLT